MSTVTQVTITEEVTDLSVTNTNAVSLDLTTEDVSVSINNFAIPVNFMDAANVVFAGHNTITARELQISNSSSGSAGVYVSSNAIEIHDGTRVRVKIGAL